MVHRGLTSKDSVAATKGKTYTGVYLDILLSYLELDQHQDMRQIVYRKAAT